MNFFSIINTALVFWIIMDALGNVPLFLSILKPFDPSHQRKIIFREMVIALAFMIFFLFFGQSFFKILNISQPSLQIAGGIILLIIAIRMVFSSQNDEAKEKIKKEPLIVPLAIPAVAGPGILTTITLYGAGLDNSKLGTLIAVVIAWAFSLPILLLSSTLKKVLGANGLTAVERLFGYLVVLIAAQTTLNGLTATFHIQ